MENEKRLIDGNKAQKILANMAEHLLEAGNPEMAGAVGYAAEVIGKQKTVDAVEIPVNLGDPVYIIVNLKNNNPSHIVERVVTGIHITEKVFNHRAEKAHHYLVVNSDIGFAQHIPFTQFGKTVFFTRREAEAAYRKRKEE